MNINASTSLLNRRSKHPGFCAETTVALGGLYGFALLPLVQLGQQSRAVCGFGSEGDNETGCSDVK